VLVHKRVHLVYIRVDDDVEALIDIFVLGNLRSGELFGHRVLLRRVLSVRDEMLFSSEMRGVGGGGGVVEKMG